MRNTSLPTIFKIKDRLLIGIKIDSCNNGLSFNDWALKIHSTHWDK